MKKKTTAVLCVALTAVLCIAAAGCQAPAASATSNYTNAANVIEPESAATSPLTGLTSEDVAGTAQGKAIAEGTTTEPESAATSPLIGVTSEDVAGTAQGKVLAAETSTRVASQDIVSPPTSSASSATSAPTPTATVTKSTTDSSGATTAEADIASSAKTLQSATTTETAPASSDAEESGQAAEAASATDSYPVLEQGEASSYVTTLQEKLMDLGYLGGTTGYFGTDTEEAVIQFQEANALEEDGIVGNSTWDVLLSGNAQTA